MKIAVVFALPAEFAPWRSRHSFRRVSSGRRSYESEIGRASVRVTFSGVGAPDVRALAETVFAPPPALVIAAGIAGGLKARYRRSEILVASSVRSLTNDRTLAVDDALVSLASRCGAATIVDTFLTVDRMIVRAQEKELLGRHADAVDMESFAVLSEAARHEVPGIAIRVVGDTVDEDLPLDYSGALRPDGTIGIPRVLAEAVLQPTRWPLLVRTGVSYRRALGQLARFLDRFVGAIGEQPMVKVRRSTEGGEAPR